LNFFLSEIKRGGRCEKGTGLGKRGGLSKRIVFFPIRRREKIKSPGRTATLFLKLGGVWGRGRTFKKKSRVGE